MAISVPSVEQLADFSGRPLYSFGPFAVQALTQATLLMTIMTELNDLPEDPNMQQLMLNGILDYALVTFLDQPFQAIKANPFQSQTIGSTSYSKPVIYMRGNAAANALKGEQTGIVWFDLAVQQLALRTQRGGVFGSATQLFDGCTPDGMYIRTFPNGDQQILGPADVDRENIVLFDWNTDWASDENSTESN